MNHASTLNKNDKSIMMEDIKRQYASGNQAVFLKMCNSTHCY